MERLPRSSNSVKLTCLRIYSIETKGLNYVDREKAKREAQHNVEKYYEHEHERR